MSSHVNGRPERHCRHFFPWPGLATAPAIFGFAYKGNTSILSFRKCRRSHSKLQSHKVWSMPQATLLDFFKSQTPGPFAPVAAPAESTNSQQQNAFPDAHREYDSVFGTAPPDRSLQIKNIAAPVPVQEPVQTDEEMLADQEEPNIRLPHISGLTIVTVGTDHLPAVKRLTGNLLPVRYPDKFFDGAVNEAIPATFSRVALIDDKPVGWIRCRLDPFPEPTEPPSNFKPIYNRVYVQALCLLAPYRGLGIATLLLHAVTAPSLIRDHEVAHVYAHVWEANEEAIEWYDKRGFHQVMKIDRYYRKLRPGGAWIVRKDLR